MMSSMERFGSKPARFKRPRRLDCAQHADYAIVAASVWNGVNVRAGCDW